MGLNGLVGSTNVISASFCLWRSGGIFGADCLVCLELSSRCILKQSLVANKLYENDQRLEVRGRFEALGARTVEYMERLKKYCSHLN